jgi:hypothetical protein
LNRCALNALSARNPDGPRTHQIGGPHKGNANEQADNNNEDRSATFLIKH